MSIQIHINGENATEVIRELSVLASHLSPSAGTTTPSSAPASEAPKTTRTRSTTKPTEVVKEEIDVDKITKEIAEEAGEESESDLIEDEIAVTVEELRAKAAEVSKSGKQAEVKALLTKFEAASISAVPEDKRSEFLKALEAL